MSYARNSTTSHMSGVGLIVVSSTLLLLTQYPLNSPYYARMEQNGSKFARLLLIGLALGLLPLDLLGGYFLPNRWP